MLDQDTGGSSSNRIMMSKSNSQEVAKLSKKPMRLDNDRSSDRV